MKAYSYTRFSTKEQMKGASLLRQMEKSAKYAADNDLVLDTSLNLHDVGSAWDGTNITKGALGAFIAAIDEGFVEPGSVLIVESLDRVSRAEPMIALELFLGIIRKGITIITLSDNQKYSKESIRDNSMLLFASIMVMIRANEESVRKSERIGDAWQRKVKKALSGSNDGKIVTAKLPLWMEVVDGKPTLIPERAEIIKRIFHLVKSGHSTKTIAQILNQETPAWSGTGWRNIYISNVTRSHSVYGAYESAGVVGEIGYYPPVITKEEFDYARHLLSARCNSKSKSRGSTKGKAVTNLFSGIAHCGYCGSKLNIGGHVSKVTGRNNKYLACSGARNGSTNCICIAWHTDDFEALFFFKISQVDIATAVGADQSDKIEALHKEIVSLGNDMDLAQKKIANLYSAIELDPIPGLIKALRVQEDLYAEQEKNQRMLESALNAARMTSTKGSSRMRSLMTLFKTLAKCEDELTLRRTREALYESVRNIVTKITVYPSGPSADRTNVDMRYALVEFKSGHVMEISEG